MLNVFSVQHYRGEEQVGELLVSDESTDSAQPGSDEEEAKVFDGEYWELFGREVGKVEDDLEAEEDS